MGVSLISNTRGRFMVWEKPISDMSYVIGADVAEGKSVSNDPHAGPDGRDFCAAAILREDTGALVGGFLDQLPSDEYAIALALMGEYYNWALLATEANAVGVSTIHTLNKASYPNMYQPLGAKIKGEADYGGLKRLGWVTSRMTKPLLIQAIRFALAYEYKIPWGQLIEQLESLEKNPKTGSAQAPYGMHDDIAMAYGIGQLVRFELVGEDLFDTKEIKSGTEPESRLVWKMIQRGRDMEDDDE